MTVVDPRDLKSFVRMFTEVGVCIWCLARFGDELWLVPTILSAYFLGNLVHAGLSIRLLTPLHRLGLLLPTGLIAVAAAMLFDHLPALAAALFVTGFAMGIVWEPASARDRKRLVKIGAKLLGMMSAAIVLLGPIAFAAIAVSLSVWLLAMQLAGRTMARAVEASSWRCVDTVNIFHQSAYFSFVYVFWATLSAAPAWTPALLFPLGWLGYWGMELSLSAPGQPYRPRLLAAGHALVAVALFAMAVAVSPWLIMLCWFLTGLGGGTCYTMERAAGGRPNRLSDDIGALLGVGGAGLALLWFPTPATTMVLASIQSLIVVGVALFTRKPAMPGGWLCASSSSKQRAS